VTLNAPKTKGSLALDYRNPSSLTGEVRVRYNAAFPVQSGVYVGTACIEDNNPLATDCVKAYTLLDGSLSYTLKQLRGAQLQLSVNNILNEKYQSFIGVPAIGTLAIFRVRYTLK
jgi:outer membrane receptor protein involved in Fe transport